MQLEDIAVTRRCLWLLYGQEAPSTQAQLGRKLRMSSPAVVRREGH